MPDMTARAERVTLKSNGVLIERLEVPHREVADYLSSLSLKSNVLTR
jgi:hypothetical protein